MCGTYTSVSNDTPRHLRVLYGETIVGRTIRLLKKNGISDICISSTDERFKQFGVPVINEYHKRYYWTNAFYHTIEPTCYIFGDVFYSPQAIRTIISTETDSIEFFASAKPFSKYYIKTHEEPFAFKVQDTEHFKKCIERTKWYYTHHYIRRPIAWQLWNVIKGTPLEEVPDNYTVINDYTVDIDSDEQAKQLQRKLKILCPGI